MRAAVAILGSLAAVTVAAASASAATPWPPREPRQLYVRFGAEHSNDADRLTLRTSAAAIPDRRTRLRSRPVRLRR